jgi:hypothetical protein
MQADTSITPLALFFLVAMGFLTLRLPRSHAFVPLLVTACFMPLGQALVVFGINFHLFRVLLLLGMVRVFLRGEARHLQLIGFDKLFLTWVAVSIVFGTLAKPSTDLFISRMGDAYNAVCAYFFLRCVITEWTDIIRAIRVLAIVAVPLACLLIIEKMTGHNILSVFGGVPELTSIREGRLRCQGAFRHPILAGTFGATLFPLVLSLWFYDFKLRRLAIAGGLACMVIIITSASSGPLLAWCASFVGLALWRFRNHMRLLRWGIVISVVALALLMNAPVYYIIARISDFTGGTGWHRSYLIDVALHHLDEWWLFGTTYTAHWGPAGEVIVADPNNMDITNHFIMEGVRGGLLRLGLFVLMIVRCFQLIGRRLVAGEGRDNADIVIWSLGVSLFAHCVSFISIPYFDQIIVFWYWLLAAIALLGLPHAGMPPEEPEDIEMAANETEPAIGVSLMPPPLHGFAAPRSSGARVFEPASPRPPLHPQAFSASN